MALFHQCVSLLSEFNTRSEGFLSWSLLYFFSDLLIPQLFSKISTLTSLTLPQFRSSPGYSELSMGTQTKSSRWFHMNSCSIRYLYRSSDTLIRINRDNHVYVQHLETGHAKYATFYFSFRFHLIWLCPETNICVSENKTSRVNYTEASFSSVPCRLAAPLISSRFRTFG